MASTESSIDTNGNNLWFPNDTKLSYRFVSRSDGDFEVTAPTSGEVVFRSEVPGSENQDSDLLVIRNANELWVILHLYRMTWADRSFHVAERVDVGDALGRAAAVELEVYDHLAQRYVNPRALFPYMDGLHQDGLPPLSVLQAGVFSDPEKLKIGTVQIVISQEDVQFSDLPRRIYILRNGLLQAQHSFVFRDDVRALTTPQGGLLLFETRAEPGINEIELEAERFDGSVERQTVQLFVPEISEDGGSTADRPIDTP